MTYPYNIEIDVAGITFTGPGMDTKQEAQVLATNLEGRDTIQDVRMIEQ